MILLTHVGVFMLVYFSTRYLGHNYYTYHRALTYTLFIYVTFFAIGLSVFLNRIHRHLSALVVIAILLLSGRSAIRTLQQFYWHHQTVDAALISLQELPPSFASTPFFTDDMMVGEHNLWRRLWQEHLLSPYQIVSRQNYPTDYASTSNITLILSAKDTIRENADRLDYETIVWENKFYTLGTLHRLTIDPALKVIP